MERTDSGRIRRNKANQDKVKETVTEMRQRLYGARNPEDPRWGYTLGRIYLDGNLGNIDRANGKGLAEMRLEAGNTYAEDVARYYALTGIPFPSARAQNLFAVHGFDGDVTEDRARRARQAGNKFMELEGVLLRCERGRQVSSAVKSVCIMDIEEARLWPDHMIDLLITGLDAMLFHYGLERERQIS